MSLIQRAGVPWLLLPLLTSMECSSIDHMKAEYHACKAERYEEKLAERARKREERELEELKQLCYEEHCRKERAQCDCCDTVRETVEVEQVAHQDLLFGLNQSFQLERIELDVEELAALQKERDRMYAEELATWERINKLRLMEHEQARLEAIESYVRTEPCDCARPELAGIPELAPFRPTPKPERAAILATEIPLSLRVRLGVGVEQPAVEAAGIRTRVRCDEQEPTKDPCRPIPCDYPCVGQQQPPAAPPVLPQPTAVGDATNGHRVEDAVARTPADAKPSVGHAVLVNGQSSQPVE